MLSYPHLAITAVEARYDQGDEIARRHGQPMVSTACDKQVTSTLATRREDLVRCADCLAAMASRPYVEGEWTKRECDECGREVAARSKTARVFCTTCDPSDLPLQPSGDSAPNRSSS